MILSEFFVFGGVALAAAPAEVGIGFYPVPTWTETRLASTMAQTITIPYSFAPIDFTTGFSGPDIPTIDLGSVGFINLVGSIALTVLGIIDDLGIVGYFVLVLIGVMIIIWLWSFVTRTPTTPPINMSGAVDTGTQVYSGYYNAQAEKSNALMSRWDETANQQLYNARNDDEFISGLEWFGTGRQIISEQTEQYRGKSKRAIKWGKFGKKLRR